MTGESERVLQAQVTWLKEYALRYHAAWLRSTHTNAEVDLIQNLDQELDKIKQEQENGEEVMRGPA
jgi:hypothetical protein